MYESTAVWRLFERYPRPAFIADTTSIRRLNRAATTALGWRDQDVVGTSRDELVRASSLDVWLNEALARDRVVRSEAQVRTSSGHWMGFHVEVRVFDDAGTFLVELLQPLSPGALRRSSVPPPADVLRFDIDTTPASFGTVCHCAPGTPVEVGSKCYDALFGHRAPCSDCPAMALPVGGAATDIYHHADRYHVVRSRWMSADVASIELTAIDDALARELLQAQLTSLAERGGLSPREQHVFELLVLGRTLVEIAEILGIAERTVRFHQANVLGKLGADSRLDLLRLLL